MLDRSGVLGVVGGGSQGGDDGRGGRADGQGVEVLLEKAVQLGKVGGHSRKNVSVKLMCVCGGQCSFAEQTRTERDRSETYSFLQETSPGRHLGQVEKVDELGSVPLSLSVLGDRNGQSGKKDETDVLLGVLFSERSGGSPFGKQLVSPPSSGVEDSHRATLRLEHLGQLFVVVDHHGRLEGLLGGGVDEQTLDVLDGPESLLPELKVDGRVELLESDLEESGKNVGLGEVDRVLLMGVFVNGGEILSDDLAKSSELGLSSVLDAEGESSLDDVLLDGKRVWIVVS